MRICYSLAALLAVGVGLGGCGTEPRSAAPAPSLLQSALRGSPPPLADIHIQANLLLGGGAPAFKARLIALRGYPLVINKWGSWCGPCQSEFPAFQRAAVDYGRRVAFIGVDGKDAEPAAAAFLHRFPVTYPSYTDPRESIARTIQAATYFPQTVYIDRKGHIVYDHAGPYLSAGALERDIRRYVLP